jgi:hypothetical protein
LPLLGLSSLQSFVTTDNDDTFIPSTPSNYPVLGQISDHIYDASRNTPVEFGNISEFLQSISDIPGLDDLNDLFGPPNSRANLVTYSRTARRSDVQRYILLLKRQLIFFLPL